jgi:hypothetical protein
MFMVSNTKLAFMTVLALAIVGLGASLLMSPSQTYGLETDDSAVDQEEEPLASGQVTEPIAPSFPFIPTFPEGPVSSAGSGEGTAAGDALPPQAPIDQPAGEVGSDVTRLPSAGSGGYVGGTSASLAQLLLFSIAALIGSGGLVWSYARTRRW